MTEQFESAADLMRSVLGAPAHPFVLIPHPISSATDTQLGDRAAQAAAAVHAFLTGANASEGAE